MSTGNIQIGPYSLEKNEADNNLSIGWSNLNSNISGTLNVSIGNNNGMNMNASNNNIFIGHNVSSETLTTTGDNNTIIGYNSSSNNFSNCIIIGNNATATQNNQLLLGSSTNLVPLNGSTIVTPSSFPEGLKICINGVEYVIPLLTPPV